MWRCVNGVFRSTRRTAEQIVERCVGHPQAGAVIEVAEVEPEGAVRLDVDQLVQDQLGVFRLAIGGQPHDLVLAGIHLESEIVSQGRVEQAERMREMDLARDLEILALADAGRGGRPLADTVERQYRSLLERRGIEGAGGVAR